MTTRKLYLFEDRLDPFAKAVHLPMGSRAVYVHAGALDFVDDESSQWLTAGNATVGQNQTTLQNGPEETILWRWELTAEDTEAKEFHFRSAPQTASAVKLEMPVELSDGFTWLMRCDTVTFPPGGIALTHLHQGPGIRITRNGLVTIETEGSSNDYGPGQAWAEKGVLPVYAPTTDQESTTFVRCFLLPAQAKGISSIRIVNAEDRSKTNKQSYRVLAERVLY